MSEYGLALRTKFWENDAKNNDGYIRKHYNQINRALEDPDYAYKMQQENLAAFLDYMTTYSSFYSNYDPTKGLSQFPVTNKLMLIEHHDEMVIDPAVIPNQTGELYIQRTSGSTGIPFAMPQNLRKRQRRIAEVKAFSALVGFESHEALAQCRVWTKWQSKTKQQATDENIYPVNVLKQDDKSLADVCNLISDNSIVAIRGYASWFTNMMNYLKRNPSEVNKLKTLIVCITHSEACDDKTREFFENTVGCNVSECYANEENGIFGQQRIGSRSYELNNTGYVFEFLKLDSDEPAEFGELSRIVVTDLHQRAFPVIRYDTGDTGIFSPVAPGSTLPRLDKLFGRVLDLVYDTDGKPIHPMSFNRVLKNLEGIKQWQFVQTGETTYDLRMVVEDDFDPTVSLKEIGSFLGDKAQLNIVYVDEIPVLGSGKRRSVVNEWKKQA